MGGGGLREGRLGGGGPGGAIWDVGGGGGRLPIPNHIKTEYWDRAGGGGNIRYEW